MSSVDHDTDARVSLAQLARDTGFDVGGGHIRRTSSRVCLGVEHGDYNGTELFGVGTDRFLWLAYKANDSGRVRLFSGNFAADGVVEFAAGAASVPDTQTASWARFPLGVEHEMRRRGYRPQRGVDVILHGNIPGGGMSRSASLTLNLLLTLFEVNGIEPPDGMDVVEMAQAVENDWVGSPCGLLDQVMIYFARAGMGTHYRPAQRAIEHVPLGAGAADFRIVSLDTGTVRAGLQHATYPVRRAECARCLQLAREATGMPLASLADVRDAAQLQRIADALRPTAPELLDRLLYVYRAQQRFALMLQAWRDGDIATVGRVFRDDGRELRDLYRISGPELETMCDIARTVPGVFGERMLGGGDKGAAGALVAADAVDALRQAVQVAYPRSHPEAAARHAVHSCRIVDGVVRLAGL